MVLLLSDDSIMRLSQNAEDCGEISFVQVDDSKTVKFEVVGFFGIMVVTILCQR